MHDIAKDKEKTDTLIKKVISNKDENKLLTDYETKSNELKKSLSKSILDVFQLQTDIENLQLQLKEKGDKKGVETEIQRLNTKIQELSINATITQQDLETYQNLLKEIIEKEQLIRQSDNDLFYLSTIINKSIIDAYYINELDDLSSSIKSSITDAFNKFSTDINANWIKYIESINETIKIQKQEYKTQIENIKSSDLYKKGTQYYSNNKELNDIQNKLKEENNKLQGIKGFEKKLNQFDSRKNAAIAQIITDHNSYKSNAQSLVQSLKIEYEGVKIEPYIDFQQQKQQDFLESRMYKDSTERKKIISDFNTNYKEQLSTQVTDFLNKALKNELKFIAGNNAENVVKELFTTNWFDISFELFYQNDIFSEMSQGKQAFVILKLLLEFSTKECPIMIDQPEDSLDNRAIYNELVQYLRAKKKKRQIILVTHNPNVVVSADAENVIVANQNGKNSLNKDNIKFQYLNGSLENTMQKDDGISTVLESQGIREHVCEILEGGKEAFENREKKYGFKK
ncbi:MAG: hypothetical protein LBI78_06475 [Campylobacteraceae bacterium]|jgi:hypothetical protein|nr:hypothetical protein [Campylobacteraceae bacterium]